MNDRLTRMLLARGYFDESGSDGGDGGGNGGGADGGSDGGGGGDGGSRTVLSADNWREFIPEEYKSDPSFSEKNVKDIGGLFSAYANAQRYIGSSVQIPGKNADDQQRKAFYEKLAGIDGIVRMPDPEDADGMAAFYTKLGRPEKAESYDFAQPDESKIPAGFQVDSSLAEAFKPVAHELGLTGNQFSKIAEWFTGSQIAQAEAKAGKFTEAEESLKREWGKDYEQRTLMAQNLLKKFADDQAIFELELGEGNNPGLTKMLSKLATMVMEDDAFVGDRSGNEFERPTSDIQFEISELRANKAFLDRHDPQHKTVVEKVNRLTEIMVARRGDAAA